MEMQRHSFSWGYKGTVYLLHFKEPHYHAQHYCGWTQHLSSRIKKHRKGISGVALMKAIKEAGIGFKVAKLWRDKDRFFERRLKNLHNSPRLCPICQRDEWIKYNLGGE